MSSLLDITCGPLSIAWAFCAVSLSAATQSEAGGLNSQTVLHWNLGIRSPKKHWTWKSVLTRQQSSM